MAWDVQGNGKTAVKFGTGKYVRAYSTGFAETYDPNFYTSATLTWNDLNRDDTAQGVRGCVYLTPGCEIDFSTLPSSFGQKPNQTPADGLKRPYQIETNLSVQREVVPGTSVTPAPKPPAQEKGNIEKLPAPKEGESRSMAPARVNVKAPADAKVTVNGQLTDRRSSDEEFLTPDLKPGYTYSYLFRVEAVRDGKPVTRTQRIVVRAGQKTEVDFSDLQVAGPVDTARVTVVLPVGARFYVDGTAIPVPGARSTFETPRLEPGKTYHYNLEARLTLEGRSEVLKQRVKVQAGKELTVNFVEKVTARLSRR